ncbi:hypothetical protein ACC862_18060 [Rhizobium ruizarguesonis]
MTLNEALHVRAGTTPLVISKRNVMKPSMVLPCAVKTTDAPLEMLEGKLGVQPMQLILPTFAVPDVLLFLIVTSVVAARAIAGIAAAMTAARINFRKSMVVSPSVTIFSLSASKKGQCSSL